MTSVKLKRDYYPPQHRSGGVRVMSGYVWSDGVYSVEIRKMEKSFRIKIYRAGKWITDGFFPSVKKCRQAIIEALNKDCGEVRYK